MKLLIPLTIIVLAFACIDAKHHVKSHFLKQRSAGDVCQYVCGATDALGSFVVKSVKEGINIVYDIRNKVYYLENTARNIALALVDGALVLIDLEGKVALVTALGSNLATFVENVAISSGESAKELVDKVHGIAGAVASTVKDLIAGNVENAVDISKTVMAALALGWSAISTNLAMKAEFLNTLKTHFKNLIDEAIQAAISGTIDLKYGVLNLAVGLIGDLKGAAGAAFVTLLATLAPVVKFGGSVALALSSNFAIALSGVASGAFDLLQIGAALTVNAMNAGKTAAQFLITGFVSVGGKVLTAAKALADLGMSLEGSVEISAQVGASTEVGA